MSRLSFRWHSSILEIPEEYWNDLSREDAIPFYKWEWLKLIEKSESISVVKGWKTSHLTVWRGDKLVALAPLYIKYHSFGEFIFDQSFAKLASELGLNYYPKLIGMSPFSPVEGYRFYFLSTEDEEELTSKMLEIIDNFALDNGILSCNFLYVDQHWSRSLERLGCAKWINNNSLWSATGKKDFSEFISTFNSNQRRNIKRERKSIQENRIEVTTVHGSQLDLVHMQRMHDLYQRHCARWGIWGSKYLTIDFFENLADPSLRDFVVLFNANRGDIDQPIAMSLCITDGVKLWGRYWGAYEEIPNLHFEVCYYSPIEWSLQNGIRYFDPGAGGSHKLRRGFCLRPQISMHRWYDETLNLIIRQWLNKVNILMLDEIEAVNSQLPFKI